MIRKPTEEDFREGKTVTVLRETKRVSVESGKGVGKGIANAYLYFFGAMMAFGFLASLLSFAASGGLEVVIGLIVVVVALAAIYKRERRKPGMDGGELATFPRAPTSASRVRQEGAYRLDRAMLFQKAVMLAVPAILIFIVGRFAPLQVAGVAMFALAVLLVIRGAGDTNVLEFDHRTVKVKHLLGEGEILWADVDDIYLRTFSRLNVRTIFATGSRRNLVIYATRNRMDGPTQLLVPIDLLGFDKQALAQLVTDLLCCRAAGGEVVPTWQQQAATASPVPEHQPRPTSDPRDSFDPDAIIARYLAGRDQVIAETRPDLQGQMTPPVRRTFGRKSI